MRNDSERKWWKRRRVWWPLGTLLMLVAAAGLAVARSNASRVLVYNETGAPIAQLTINASGQTHTFHDVGEYESVRFKLSPTGGPSDIAIVTNGVEMWHGDYIEPSGGYRAIVRLRRDGQVECTTTICWWRSLLGSLTATSSSKS